MSFSEKDKIIIKDKAVFQINGEGFSGKIGKIVRVYPELDLAIVNYPGSCGNVKIPLSVLNRIADKVEEPVKKSEITITRERFREIVLEVLDPENLVKGTDGTVSPTTIFMVGMSGALIGAKIENALFGELDGND